MSNPTELLDLDRQFRKKPVVIEAIQWTGKLACLDAFNIPELHQSLGSDKVGIPTLEGTMIASVGDWIIKGVKGEFYPCKPDIFEATYELAARRAQPEGEAPQAVACPACEGKGGWMIAEWTDPVSGPECEGERCEECEGTGKVAAALSPLCGARHEESGSIEDYNEFNRLLDELEGAKVDAHACGNDFGTGNKHQAAYENLVAYIDGFTAHAVSRRVQAALKEAAQQAAAPADCTGTPSSCPDNEGYGCHCSAPGTPEAPKGGVA